MFHGAAVTVTPLDPPLRATQSDAATLCEGDCSLFVVDENCIQWNTGKHTVADPATTDSSEVADLCPLGSMTEPICSACASTYYLVRACMLVAEAGA